MTKNDNALAQSYFEEAAEYWENIYEQPNVYALIHQQRRELVVGMIDALGLAPGARVLEIGCGAGHLAVHLAQRGFQVTAIDAARSMVEATRHRALGLGMADRLSVETGDSAKLSFPDAAFDLVVAIGVMPWTTEVASSLKEMARVAKPGGAVLVTMDNRWAAHRVLDPRLCPPAVWAKRLVSSVLSAARFRALKARAHTHSIGTFDRLLRDAGLFKREGRTLGFGPFTFWNREWLGNGAAATLHQRLQNSADCGMAWARNRGAQYIVLANR